MDDKHRTQLGKPSRSAGFSLVEVMGGVVLAGIALPGILYTTVNVASLRRVDEQRNIAFAACRARLEELRNTLIADLPALDGTGFQVDVDGNGTADLSAIPGDADGLPGEISVVVQETLVASTLYRVRATVRWTGAARTQTFSLGTLMTSRRGN